MRLTIFLLLLFLTFTTNMFGQDNVLELDNQSMCITGKGPGQDGAINPYAGENCMAIVQNLGNNRFSIRLERDGKIVEEIPINPKDAKKVRLPKGTVLYFDSSLKTKAKVDFKRMAY